MLVNFNPNISNNHYKKNQVAFQALEINKISNSINAAEILYIKAKGGGCPKTPENAKDLLTAINQTKDIEVKDILMEIAQNIWKIITK